MRSFIVSAVRNSTRLIRPPESCYRKRQTYKEPNRNCHYNSSTSQKVRCPEKQKCRQNERNSLWCRSPCNLIPTIHPAGGERDRVEGTPVSSQGRGRSTLFHQTVEEEYLCFIHRVGGTIFYPTGGRGPLFHQTVKHDVSVFHIRGLDYPVSSNRKDKGTLVSSMKDRGTTCFIQER